VQLQTQLGTDASAIHSHFTFADHPVDATAGYRPETPLEVVVEALSGLFLTHLEMPDFGAGGAGVVRGDGVFGVRHCFYNGLSSILSV
jgi:hypothetical protein